MLFIICIAFTAISLYFVWYVKHRKVEVNLKTVLSVCPALTILLDCYYMVNRSFGDSTIFLLLPLAALVYLFIYWVVLPNEVLNRFVKREVRR